MNNYTKCKNAGITTNLLADYLNELGHLPPRARRFTGGNIRNTTYHNVDSLIFQAQCADALQLHIQKISK
jgi:hypothetical protein